MSPYHPEPYVSGEDLVLLILQKKNRSTHLSKVVCVNSTGQRVKLNQSILSPSTNINNCQGTIWCCVLEWNEKFKSALWTVDLFV